MSRKRRAKGKARQAKPSFSTDDFLKAVPYKNHAMKTTPQPGKKLLAEVPMKRPRGLIPPFSWLLPYSSHRRVELDAVGAEVLGLCDGNRTVESIIENFAQHHKLSFRESQLSVTRFLQMLVERGLIAIVGRGQKPGQAHEAN
jgi:hypothetical protein